MGEVKACNAGHEPPVVLKKGDDGKGSFEVLEEEHGMPMALLPDMPFPEIEWQLHPGDRIFLRTDGVDEAQKEDGEMLGQDRMLEILNEHREEDDRSLCETIVVAVDRHVGEDPQFDDITVLSLTIKSLKNP